MAHVITNVCICCGVCPEECPVEGCITLGDGIYVIDSELCDDCGICAVECPVHAIVEGPK